MPLSIFSLSRDRRRSSREGLLLRFMSRTSSSSSISSSSMSLHIQLLPQGISAFTSVQRPGVLWYEEPKILQRMLVILYAQA